MTWIAIDLIILHTAAGRTRVYSPLVTDVIRDFLWNGVTTKTRSQVRLCELDQPVLSEQEAYSVKQIDRNAYIDDDDDDEATEDDQKISFGAKQHEEEEVQRVDADLDTRKPRYTFAASSSNVM